MDVRISKLDAARRQLETAVVLYFQQGDPVSIHTLAAAAHQLLHDISKKADSQSEMILAWALEQVLPEYRDEIRKTLRAAQNFFKHADRDESDVLEDFDQGQTEFLLIDACWAYRRLTGERLPVFTVFEMWSALTWAKPWLQYATADALNNAIPISTQERWAAMSRQQFFAQCLPAAYAATVGAGTVAD